jgi:hypothetical protein
MRAPLGDVERTSIPLNVKFQALSISPKTIHWELIGNSLRTHWDLQSRMQQAHVIMVSLNAKFHVLEIQLALKRSEHIASTPPI